MKPIVLVLLLWFCALPAMAALDPAVVKRLAAEESDDKIAAIQQLSSGADKDAARVLKALSEDALFVSGDQVFLLDGDKPVDAATGAAIRPTPASFEAISINNRIRSELGNAIAALRLFDPGARGTAGRCPGIAKQCRHRADSGAGAGAGPGNRP